MGALARAQEDDDEKPARPARPAKAEAKDAGAAPLDALERARFFMDHGRHDEAEALASELAANSGKAWAPRQLLAELYLKTGRDADAAKTTEDLVKRDRARP